MTMFCQCIYKIGGKSQTFSFWNKFSSAMLQQILRLAFSLEVRVHSYTSYMYVPGPHGKSLVDVSRALEGVHLVVFPQRSELAKPYHPDQNRVRLVARVVLRTHLVACSLLLVDCTTCCSQCLSSITLPLGLKLKLVNIFFRMVSPFDPRVQRAFQDQNPCLLISPPPLLTHLPRYLRYANC